MGFDGVDADAEDGGVEFFELGVVVAEGTGFLGAAGGIVLGIEEEDDEAAFEVG